MQHKSSYVWGAISRFAPQGLYMITTMILARFLSPDDFGTIGVLSIFFMIANTLIDSGLGGSLIKEKVISKIDCSTISTFNIAISTSIYLVIYFCSPLIEAYYQIENLTLVTRLVCLEFVITSFGLVPKSLLVRQLRFKAISYASIFVVIVASLLSVSTAYLGFGVFALVTYRLSYALVRVVVLYFLSKYKLSFSFSLSSFKRLIPFGIYTTITSIIDTIYENLLTTLTGKYMNVKEAGYMYQSKQLETVSSSSVATTIGSVSFPILTKLKDDDTAFKKEAASIYRTVIVLIAPILLSAAVFSKPIIYILYGSQWERSSFYLSWLLIAGLLHIMENLNRVFIKAHADVGQLTFVTLIKRGVGIFIILICLILSPVYIVYGYIISTFFAYLCNQILYCRIMADSLWRSLFEAIRILVPSLALCGMMILFNWTFPMLWLQILVVIISLLFYYLYISPRLGVNIVSILRN